MKSHVFLLRQSICSLQDEYVSEINTKIPLSEPLSPHISVSSIPLPTNYKTISKDADECNKPLTKTKTVQDDSLSIAKDGSNNNNSPKNLDEDHDSSSKICVEINPFCFFFLSGFFHEHSRFTGHQGKGEADSLNPLYHFHPLHRHLDISRTITAKSSTLSEIYADSVVKDLLVRPEEWVKCFSNYITFKI